jgi:threonine dehydrogenase-like Zn-dependent dehydrogenase
VGEPLEIREYPVLAPGAGQVRLRLARSGICGTDIHILEGRLPVPPPLIPGHEFIGVVDELGEGAGRDGLGQELAIGDRVVACVAIPCGTCFNCRRGETASCLNFGVTYVHDPDEPPHFFGGYGEVLHSPADNLVRIPDGLDLDAAAALPCAGPTCIRAFDFAGNLAGDELVVVQGTGPVGLFAVAWAAAAGCRVLAIGSSRNPERTRLAKELGAVEVLDFRALTREDMIKRVRQAASDMDRGDGADVVFEASGAPDAFCQGLDLVRTLGRFVVPGQYSDSGDVSIQPSAITFRAIHVVGSGQYKLTDIGTYLRFLMDHPRVAETVGQCISHRFSVSEADAACAAAARGEVVKAVFVSDAGD